jgi:purine-binding chemotaxis protein CheW
MTNESGIAVSATAVAEQRLASTAEEKARILKARAKALAREPPQHAESAQYLEIVECLLAYESYAIESAFVREVYPLRELTPLPGTPAFVLGIVNVRGQILSVVDLKKFFDLPAKGLTDLNKIVILSNGHMEFGLLVDAVIGVQRIAVAEIQSPLPMLSGIHADYLKGVTAQRLVILDVARILADPKIIVREDIQA